MGQISVIISRNPGSALSANQQSIVWDDLFDTDEEAYEEFLRTVREEGMIAFADEPTERPVSVH